jgi:solute:Na+ symporter, SSS family
MTLLDWAVLVLTTATIVGWGLYKTRGAAKSSDEFIRGAYVQKWPTIGLAVMATQASAITFLSTPGQAYEDGLRFVQFYFGQPLAMVLISAVFIPIYYQLKVNTAYEYLESRFDLKTRLLGASLFLVQRGLASGITLYAPAIILSAIMGWPLEPTVVSIGVLVILYTVVGGAAAVAQTQKHQMVVMLGGMAVVGLVILFRLPESVSASQALDVAGAFGRINAVSFSFDLNDRYNFWSGITGGFFLALSYFGTDQSQVGRYLAGKSIAESRLGLLFNGMLKIPMQFGILSVGILVFVFYQFVTPPLLFNDSLRARAMASPAAAELGTLEKKWEGVHAQKRTAVENFLAQPVGARDKSALLAASKESAALRAEAKAVVSKVLPGAETKDSDYIFIGFVRRFLPSGLLGLLVTVIFAAAMSSISSELSALGGTTTVDFYRRLRRQKLDDAQVLKASKLFTAFWGMVAILFATFAALLDNLIQAVNILGSLFYGTVLGLFVVAFFLKRVQGHAVFFAGLAAQTTVLVLFWTTKIGYLWFNVIGCALVVVLALALQAAGVKPREKSIRPS